MQPSLDLILEVDATLAAPLTVGPTPQGMRRVVPITGGRFSGPELSGEIVPGGADWQFDRPDGITQIEALYLLRTEDGVLIQVRSRGLRHGPPAVMARLRAGEPVEPGEYYFRATPEFSAPSGRYERLNHSIFLLSGARYPHSVHLWIYRVG